MKRVFQCSAAMTVGLFATIATAQTQTSQFRFDAAKVPQGMALHYKKSMMDGSRATHVSVYVVDGERIESLKWDDDAPLATLVKAQMDWRRFSVRRFESFQLERGKPPELRGTLEANVDGTAVKVSFLNGKVVKINHWPWHSYDFDFASLGLVLPHLRDPQQDLIFWRTDVVFAGEGMDFAEIGGVRIHYEATELRDSQQIRRYSIGGAGFEHKYGNLWTDAATGLLVEYQIPIGDEPGFKDVRLQLERRQKISPAQWEAFKKSKLGER